MARSVAQSLVTPFVWGAGGAALTPEEIAKRREEEAAALAKGGIDMSPVLHPLQGASRILNSAAGAYRRRRLDAQQGENDSYNQSIVQSLLGGSAGSDIPMSSAAGEIEATGPVQPIDMTGNEVYGQFMDTVRGTVNNPYALAAIAATGKAESGFDPGNVNRTWSDPSESGQPGTAGGILSWRGPRYEALAATGDLSPAGQARFFLQENPQLIEALNNAGSVEEAMSLMNNAWKFAGYNRPGGEAANRLAYAQSFLPTFGTDVAAASPADGSLSDEVSAFQQTPEYAAQFPGMTSQQFDERFTGVAQPVENAGGVASALAGGDPAGASQPVSVAQALSTGQQPQRSSTINPAILRALADPRANAQTRGVAELLLKQQLSDQQSQADRDNWLFQQDYQRRMQEQDPLRALQLERAQLENEALRNPRQEQTAEMQNLAWRAQEAGLQPGTPEYADFMVSGGRQGMTINNMGNIPAGYEIFTDPETQATRMRPIPGGPADTSGSDQAAAQNRETSTSIITNAANLARQAANSEGLPATGTIGGLLSGLPETNAAELRRQVDVLKSNAKIENLQAMRAASPTGGALGSVSNQENEMLAAKAGALDPSSPNFLRDLDDYERTLLRTVHGRQAGDAIFEATRTRDASTPPNGISQEDWDFLTPEERRLFQ